MSSVLTPGASKDEVSMPVAGEPGSAATLRNLLSQPLLNRVYRVEQILEGAFSQAVTLLAAFWAKGNSTFGVGDGIDETAHDVYSYARFHGTSARTGPEISSVKYCADAYVTENVYKRHFEYQTTTNTRVLNIGFTTPVSSSFTVWNGGAFAVAVMVGGSTIGTVVAGSHRTFRANASGILHMYS